MNRTYFILNPDEIAAFRFQVSGERRQESAANSQCSGNTKSHPWDSRHLSSKNWDEVGKWWFDEVAICRASSTCTGVLHF